MSNTESKPREFVVVNVGPEKVYQAFLKIGNRPNNLVNSFDAIEATPFVKKAVENHAAFKQLVMDILAQQGIGCHLSGEYERRAVELLKASE